MQDLNTLKRIIKVLTINISKSGFSAALLYPEFASK